MLFGPFRWPQWLTGILLGIGGVSSLGVILLPISWFISTLIVIQIYWIILFILTFMVLLENLKKKVEDVGLFVLSFSIFVLGALNDILLTRLYVPTISMVTLAQGCFILVQSVALARRFAREYRRNKNLEEANAHLLELEEARSRFFAAASHELRTPVSLIITPVDAIMKGAYGETLPYNAPVFSLIHRNCNRLKHLAEELLQVLKIDAGMMKPQFQKVDISTFLQTYVALYSPEAANRHIELEYHVLRPATTTGLYAHTDPVLLETVILNLLSNALKFTPQEGRVLVQVLPPEQEHICFVIQDTGPGIPLDKQAQLFTRFAAASSGQGKGEMSFGIGLPLSAELMKLLGGSLSVESSPGHGSRFQVCIPRWLEPKISEASEAGTLPKPELRAEADNWPKRVGSTNTSATILLLEDDDDMRNFLQESLSPQFSVYGARSGAEGLTMIRNGLVPDLIISDVMMYPMDGLEFRKQVCALPGFGAIPFLFITASQESSIHSQARGSGAVDVIQKPFYIDELLTKIASLLELMNEKQKYMEQWVLEALRGEHAAVHRGTVSWQDRLGSIKLTERDREVLELLLQGLSDKEIAVQLQASVRTISNRVSSILKRTGQPSRTALIAYLGGRE
jgi:signal transduction histidine kinase/DNA-binding NarL/FixJ family response regulator